MIFYDNITYLFVYHICYYIFLFMFLFPHFSRASPLIIARRDEIEWERHVRKQTLAWVTHADHWRSLATSGTPYIIIKYEDLVARPAAELDRLFRWHAAGNPPLLNALLRRLKVCSESIEAVRERRGGYGARDRSGESDAFTGMQSAFVLRQTYGMLCDEEVGYGGMIQERFNVTCEQLKRLGDVL